MWQAVTLFERAFVKCYNNLVSGLLFEVGAAKAKPCRQINLIFQSFILGVKVQEIRYSFTRTKHATGDV
ncbi:hypothetical protein DXT99_24705 [Pontibacter diazotrophicus]|uniref:Uncharacterized protein n=1 Tax=Pontibacter diazotrophicus TaxID=1400979 RepID=A0A3D8L207_9BACT|nr:hypothetical protein DXT99_24705 [Pontibacter diazotrophicus]